MTNAMMSELQTAHKDEMADVDKYKKMADEAAAAGKHRVAGILRDISREEHSHAKLLQHILEHDKTEVN